MNLLKWKLLDIRFFKSNGMDSPMCDFALMQNYAARFVKMLKT